MFALVQTIIGAAAAIIGSLVGEALQTRLADDRRAASAGTNGEVSLLSLNSVVASVLADLTPARPSAARLLFSIRQRSGLSPGSRRTGRHRHQESSRIPMSSTLPSGADRAHYRRRASYRQRSRAQRDDVRGRVDRPGQRRASLGGRCRTRDQACAGEDDAGIAGADAAVGWDLYE